MGGRRWALGSVVLLLALPIAILSFGSASAVAGTVVINEILYKPADPLDGDAEFFELHNPGTTDVDLTGWTIEDPDGPNGTLSGTLLAGGYGIVGVDGFDTAGVWGVQPIGTFISGLSGSGDTIIIKDDAGNVVDEVVYDDKAPWPTAPDNDGSSLELIDALTDNSLASSWGASPAAAPTPGVINDSTVNPAAAPITAVIATPTEPAPNSPVTVVATVPGGVDPELRYVVGFGAESTVVMNDDGVAPDATAGDGVFTATIPGQAAGELIRYRITAPATGEEFPDVDDRQYEGVVVDDPAEIPTTMVEMEWFIPEADYSLMFDNPGQDIWVSGSVLAIDGVVYDNMDVKIRGGGFARATYDKQGLSFDFASGVELDRPDLVPHPIDEFALGAERGVYLGRQISSWTVFEEAGFPPVPAQHVRVQRNGEFYGVFRFSEKLDGTWRDENGIDGGFYKASGSSFMKPQDFEKKQPDDGDNQPIIDLAAVLDDPPSAAKTEYVYKNVDIPNAVNYLASAYIVGHIDSSSNNFYMHEHPNGLWQIYPWDLSNTFGVSAPNCPGTSTVTIELDCVNNPFYPSIKDIPELEDMIWRRIRTLVEGPAADGVLESQFEAYSPSVSTAERNADNAKWPAGSFTYNSTAFINTRIDQRRDWMTGNAKYPAAQAVSPAIVINELHYNPAGEEIEFLELHNPTAGSVDLSGWSIDAIDLSMPGGTVLLPGDYLVVTESIAGFLAQYPAAPNVVLVEYSGGLSGGGELVELRNVAGDLVDSVDYEDNSPWPTQPDGVGPSLSLFDPASDNALPASWGISSADGGTPGDVNDTVAPPLDPPPPIVINEIHYNPAGDGAEFIELLNTGDEDVDLGGFNLDGMLTFDQGTVISAGGYLVITENVAQFGLDHPGVAAIQWGDDEDLKNGGEGVDLKTDQGVEVDLVDYLDDPPWPLEPDGDGPSLELIDPTLDNALAASWKASGAPGGSPAAENVLLLPGSVDSLGAPSGLIAVSSPEFVWSDATSATHYRVWVADLTNGGKFFDEVLAVDAGVVCSEGSCVATPATSFADGDSYRWWVQAQNSAGVGSWSSSQDFTVELPAVIPGKATLIAPSGAAVASTPEFAWAEDGDASQYRLWVQSLSGGGVVHDVIHVVGDTVSCGAGECSVSPAGLSLASGSYRWWAQAQSAAGVGNWSDPLDFVVGTGLPAAATLLTPDAAGAGSLPEYTWNAVPGATWYYLWVNDAGGSATVLEWVRAIDAGCANGEATCSHTSATPVAGNATWWIRTWNSSGFGPWSTGTSFST